jgi:hypothetical protein
MTDRTNPHPEPAEGHSQPPDAAPEAAAAGPSVERAMHWVTIPTPPHMTTERMGKLYAATLPLLEALRDVARGQVARRGDKPVPPATLADAKALFADVRRVLSRDPKLRGLFLLGADIDWTGLFAKLELALAAFAEFRRNYGVDDDEEFEGIWRTPEWLEFCYIRAELRKQGKYLPNSVGD